jgi:hypothetical protein
VFDEPSMKKPRLEADHSGDEGKKVDFEETGKFRCQSHFVTFATAGKPNALRGSILAPLGCLSGPAETHTSNRRSRPRQGIPSRRRAVRLVIATEIASGSEARPRPPHFVTFATAGKPNALRGSILAPLGCLSGPAETQYPYASTEGRDLAKEYRPVAEQSASSSPPKSRPVPKPDTRRKAHHKLLAPAEEERAAVESAGQHLDGM